MTTIIWEYPKPIIWLPVILAGTLLALLMISCIFWRKCFYYKTSSLDISKDSIKKLHSKELPLKENVIPQNYFPYTASPRPEGSVKKGPRFNLYKSSHLSREFEKEEENGELHCPIREAIENEEDFILDLSVLNFEENKLFEKQNDGLSPQVTQELETILQKRINKAAKLVRERIDFSLPENATEEKKEEKRIILHKMVWVVAKDENLKL